MSKKENVFLLKGKSKEIRKAKSLVIRMNDVYFINVYPLDSNIYFAFKLAEKLERKLKILNLHNNIKTKKLISFNTLLTKCIKFDNLIDFDKFKEKNTETFKSKTFRSTYGKMPKAENKDNQKVYSVEKNTNWNNVSKKDLIKAGNKIRGIKIRIPRKKANKKKWKNFLERFTDGKK